MASSHNPHDIVRVLQIVRRDSWLHIVENESEYRDEIQLVSHEISPEECCLMQDAYENLSKEARVVLKTILTQPSLFITEKRKLYSKRKIYQYFKKRWSAVRARRVIKEVSAYVRNL